MGFPSIVVDFGDSVAPKPRKRGKWMTQYVVLLALGMCVMISEFFTASYFAFPDLQ